MATTASARARRSRAGSPFSIEPQLYAPRLGSLEQVTVTILRAFAEGAADASVEAGALLTINTDENLGIAGDLARIAAAHAGRGVTGLGAAGFVEPANLGRHRPSAQIAQAAGLPVVSHAGQMGGADSIEDALDQLGATRIAHGVGAVGSPALVRRLADERIACDMCPVSNARLGIVPEVARHPAPLLLAAGVPLTLNADDQLWFGHRVTDQYAVARDAWGMGDEGLARFAQAGALAAGMSGGTRDLLLAGIEAWLDGGRRA